MHITGTTQIHGAHGINGPHAPFRSQASHGSTSAPANSVDRVDISPAAQAASQAAEAGAVRQDLVRQIRAEIAAGTYETPQKLDMALDRLLDQIG